MHESKHTSRSSRPRPKMRPYLSVVREATDDVAADLTARGTEILRRRGVDGRCSVQIEQSGRWFVLRGRVDSHGTRSRLFGAIPESNGARWIVDKLRIGFTSRNDADV